MVDLDDAGRRLAAHRVGPTTPIATLQHRARRRRQRRQARRALAVAGLAVVVAAGTVLAVRSGGGGKPQRVDVVGGPNRPVALLPVAHPPGWVQSDVGRLRIWTPLWASCTDGLGGYLFEPFVNGVGEQCPPATPAPLDIRPAEATAGLARTSINGVAVWEGTAGRGAGATRTYDVPSLGVRLVAVGLTGRRVALTLGPSSLDAVLATRYPVAVPTGWKTVEWGGVAASVPASWPVRHLTRLPLQDPAMKLSGCTLFTSSVVYLGHVRGVCPGPIETGAPTALWLGNDAGPAVTASVAITTGTPGTTVTLGYSVRTALSDDVDVTIRTDHGTVQATLGLGSNPVTAEEILSSLRPSP